MRRFRVAAVGLLLAVACATSPLGRSQLMLVSDAEMEKMGLQAFEELKKKQKVSSDAEKNAYVTCVARAITSALPGEAGRGEWEVRVFEDDTANAFALPGKKIGVHTGLLKVAKNQDQLATVIGHEVAHVLARHSNERISAEIAKQGGTAVAAGVIGSSSPLVLAALGVGGTLGTLKYGRTHESEADLFGLDLMARAGFDPRQSVPLWQNMAAAAKGGRPPEFLSTHPNPESRIKELTKRIPNALPIAEQAWAQGRKPRCG